MDEREVAEIMRGLGYEFSQAPNGSCTWLKRGLRAWVYKPDKRLTRWYATAGSARQEFSCPVAAAVWITVQMT